MIYKCKYCGRVTTSQSGHSFHEKRCKHNPSHICKPKTIGISKNNIYKLIPTNKLDKYISDGWVKGSIYNRTPINKGKICITDGIKNKYVAREDLSKWIQLGWNLGQHIYAKNTSRPTGIASTPEKEVERKRKISQAMKNNPEAGGYRAGSGRGKSGWYKNIHCDSTWELAFLIYHMDHNLYIERCKERRIYTFEGKDHVYIPDFLTRDGIVEIKGYKSEQWEAKISQNPDIKVLYFDDIKPYLDYCEKQYNCKLEDLYD